MTLLLIAALLIALAALLRCRFMQGELTLEREEFATYRRVSRDDFRQNMRLAQQHDRLLGEKNNLQAANDALRAELRRRHRKVIPTA